VIPRNMSTHVAVGRYVTRDALGCFLYTVRYWLGEFISIQVRK
jgi:hypothetical protein